MKIYNAIREIYLCNSPYPHDTPKLFGLEVGISDENNWAGIILTDKKGFSDAIVSGDEHGN